MNDDANDEMPNGTPNINFFFYGVLNWDELMKSSGKLEGDHVTHLWGWTSPFALEILMRYINQI